MYETDKRIPILWFVVGDDSIWPGYPHEVAALVGPCQPPRLPWIVDSLAILGERLRYKLVQGLRRFSKKLDRPHRPPIRNSGLLVPLRVSNTEVQSLPLCFRRAGRKSSRRIWKEKGWLSEIDNRLFYYAVKNPIWRLPFMRWSLQIADLVIKVSPHCKTVEGLIRGAAYARIVHKSCDYDTDALTTAPKTNVAWVTPKADTCSWQN